MADLPSLFHAEKLKNKWTFNAGNIIWRLLFNSVNMIIGEVRNESDKSVSFFCIDAYTGKPYWRDMHLDELWWIGVEAVNMNYAVFHGYTSPYMPEHKGIYAVSVASGKLMWKNEDLTYWFMDDKNIYAQRYLFEKRIGYRLESLTGKILEEYSGNLNAVYKEYENSNDDDKSGKADIGLPLLYVPGCVEKEEILKEVGKIAAGKGAEYYFSKDRLVVSYYREEKESGKLFENVISVADTFGSSLLYEDVVARGLSAPGRDSFLIRESFLYYVKDHKKLTAIKLWN
jgi:hypothetical protein